MWAALAIAKIDIPLTDCSWLEATSMNPCAGYKERKLPDTEVIAGSEITITKGIREKYALWNKNGIYDLPEWYVDETSIRELSKH